MTTPFRRTNQVGMGRQIDCVSDDGALGVSYEGVASYREGRFAALNHRFRIRLVTFFGDVCETTATVGSRLSGTVTMTEPDRFDVRIVTTNVSCSGLNHEIEVTLRESRRTIA